jgi:hypothetical protein
MDREEGGGSDWSHERLRATADAAADTARLAQLEHEASMRAARRIHAAEDDRAPLNERAAYSAKLAGERSAAAMRAWAEAELRALQARRETEATVVDDEAAAARRVHSARKAAQARWRKRADTS